jgi:hypothetical protein
MAKERNGCRSDDGLNLGADGYLLRLSWLERGGGRFGLGFRVGAELGQAGFEGAHRFLKLCHFAFVAGGGLAQFAQQDEAHDR